MGIADEMKKLSEEIIASHKQRLQENKDMVKEVQNTLEGFQKNHQEMAANLRASLSDPSSDWRKEYNSLMSEIQNTLNQIPKEVNSIRKSTQDMLKEFNEKDYSMDHSWKEELKQYAVARHAEFKEMMSDIHATLDDISQEVEDIKSFSKSMMNNFREDNYKMSETLRNNLDEETRNLKNENLNRLKNYKETIDNIRNKVNGIKSFTADFLGERRNDRSQMSESWKNIALAKKGAKAKQMTKVKSKQQDQTIAPTKDEKEESVKHKSVEVKVLEYINMHPEGVKVSQMEEPIGEQRMRLGYVAKRLLDAGKVLKHDNVYYPINPHEN